MKWFDIEIGHLYKNPENNPVFLYQNFDDGDGKHINNFGTFLILDIKSYNFKEQILLYAKIILENGEVGEIFIHEITKQKYLPASDFWQEINE